MDTAGAGEGGTNWESSTETYTLHYGKHIANGKLLYDAGSSAWFSETIERHDGVGRRRKVQEGGDVCILWLIHVDYGRNQHNIVKQLSSD